MSLWIGILFLTLKWKFSIVNLPLNDITFSYNILNMQGNNLIKAFIEEDKKVEKWVVLIQNWDKVLKKQRHLSEQPSFLFNYKQRVEQEMGFQILFEEMSGNSLLVLTIEHLKTIQIVIWQMLVLYLQKQSFLEVPICESENWIINDIQRTFPKHPLFNSYTADGLVVLISINLDRQTSLYNILRAWANKNKDIGYCQGMGFISAIFLTYMDEEAAFWMLDYLVKKHKLHGFFMNSMPFLNGSFYKLQSLIRKYVPRIHSNFMKYKIQPSMFASQWFLTLFSVNFSFEILARIWDVYLLEGEKTIYRFGIAVLILNQDDLLIDDFEMIMDGLKRMYKDVELNKLVSTALSLKVTNKILNNLQEEFEKNPDAEIQEFIIV